MTIAIAQGGDAVATGQVIRCNFYTWIDSQLGIFGFDYKVSGITGSPHLGDMAAGVQTANSAAIAACVAAGVYVLGCKATIRVVGPIGIPGIATDDTVATGLFNPMSKQTAGIIHWRCTAPAPQNRGRMYVPFPPTSAADPSGSPNASYRGLLNALAGSIFGMTTISYGGNSISGDQTVYHSATHTDSLSFIGTASFRFATQKRRGDYGKANMGLIT